MNSIKIKFAIPLISHRKTLCNDVTRKRIISEVQNLATLHESDNYV
jgi:hypothetical protein